MGATTAADPWADLDDDELTALIHTKLNGYFAGGLALSVAYIVGFSLLLRPWWPMGLAFGLGYGGIILVHVLFMHVLCQYAMRRVGEVRNTAWRMIASGVVAIVAVVAACYAFEKLGRRRAVAIGVTCACDVVAITAILIWWCCIIARGDDHTSSSSSFTARLGSTSPEISPV